MSEIEERLRELKKMNSDQVRTCVDSLESVFPDHGIFIIKCMPIGDSEGGNIVDCGSNISKRDTLVILEETLERLKADIAQNNGF